MSLPLAPVLRLLPVLGALQIPSTCGAPGPEGGNTVIGVIRPDHFQFKTEVEAPLGPEAGGWRAVCIRARVKNGNIGTTAVCSFEVGVPIRIGTEAHEYRDISIFYAQKLSSELANTAAYNALSSLPPEAGPGMACLAFKAEYKQLMGIAFPQARVGACRPLTFVVDF